MNKEVYFVLDKILRITYPIRKDYKTDRKAERYICNCYPKCDFHIYNADCDGTILDRDYSINDLDF